MTDVVACTTALQNAQEIKNHKMGNKNQAKYQTESNPKKNSE